MDITVAYTYTLLKSIYTKESDQEPMLSAD